jgi:hypothetical protein
LVFPHRFEGHECGATGRSAAAAVPAPANHHACPVVSTIPNDDGTTTVNVARKNCAPTQVQIPLSIW